LGEKAIFQGSRKGSTTRQIPKEDVPLLTFVGASDGASWNRWFFVAILPPYADRAGFCESRCTPLRMVDFVRNYRIIRRSVLVIVGLFMIVRFMAIVYLALNLNEGALLDGGWTWGAG
jgi:hypothetical protein